MLLVLGAGVAVLAAAAVACSIVALLLVAVTLDVALLAAVVASGLVGGAVAAATADVAVAPAEAVGGLGKQRCLAGALGLHRMLDLEQLGQYLDNLEGVGAEGKNGVDHGVSRRQPSKELHGDFLVLNIVAAGAQLALDVAGARSVHGEWLVVAQFELG